MRAERLYLADGRDAGVVYCGECRVVHREIADAERCCAPLVCSGCGEPRLRGYQVCGVCWTQDQQLRELAKFEAAHKLYIETFTEDLVYAADHDRYVSFDELDDLIDEALAEFINEGNKPWEWEPLHVYATRVEQPLLDVDAAIESALDDSFDDALDYVDVKAVAALTEHVTAWSKANLPRVYYQDDKLALVPWPVHAEA